MKVSYKSKNFTVFEGEKWETSTAGKKERRNALKVGSCKFQMKPWTWGRGPYEYVVRGGESFCIREYRQCVCIIHTHICIYICICIPRPPPKLPGNSPKHKANCNEQVYSSLESQGNLHGTQIWNGTQIWKFSIENRKAQAPKLLFRF